MMKSSSNGVIFKFDMEKAYDHVDWGFLLAILGKMGFDQKWIEWSKW